MPSRSRVVRLSRPLCLSSWLERSFVSNGTVALVAAFNSQLRVLCSEAANTPTHEGLYSRALSYGNLVYEALSLTNSIPAHQISLSDRRLNPRFSPVSHRPGE